MNKLFIFAALLLLTNCTGKKKNNPDQYVEIIHTGITTHENHILYVSTKKIDIKLTNEELNDIKDILGDSVKITHEKIEDYIGMKYKRVLTDLRTLTLMQDYILSHQNFYVDANYGPASYDIALNTNQVFSINYKLRGAFFKGLTDFLQQNKCDQKIIKRMSYYE